MDPTDEELLHAFYAGDDGGLEQLDARHTAMLTEIGHLILEARTGSALQAVGEWTSLNGLAGCGNTSL
jgi:hypothetical protein